MPLRHLTLAFLQDENGLTAAEYAVIVALVLVVCIMVVLALSNASNTYSRVSTEAGKSNPGNNGRPNASSHGD
jgi:Flp pilus assembly pilin Flp